MRKEMQTTTILTRTGRAQLEANAQPEDFCVTEVEVGEAAVHGIMCKRRAAQTATGVRNLRIGKRDLPLEKWVSDAGGWPWKQCGGGDWGPAYISDSSW